MSATCASARDELDAYLTEHPATTGPLVRSYTKPWQPLHPHYLGQMAAQWMRDAGVKRTQWDGRSAHTLRHSAATEVLDATSDIRLAQELLRHTHLASTEYYLGRSGTDRVRAAREARARRLLTASAYPDSVEHASNGVPRIAPAQHTAGNTCILDATTLGSPL